MIIHPAVTTPARQPSALARLGDSALRTSAYFGGAASVAGRALQRGARNVDPDDNVTAQLAWMFALGLPLIALAHVGIGAFLAMQSYFGGTFADGTGAVVGVGLLRNMASLISGLVLNGLFATRITLELRFRDRAAHTADEEETGFLARADDGKTVRGDRPSPVAAIDGRGLRARLIAGILAGPVFGFWGAAVGTAVGWQVAQALMGVTTHAFFSMFWEMLWGRDLVGMLVKGLLFGFFAALFACHEGMRGRPDDDVASLSAAACRAACLGCVAMLIVNSSWFILAFHAGPAFGPTLLQAPSR